MAKSTKSDGPVNGILRVCAELLKEHQQQLQLVKKASIEGTDEIGPVPIPEPIDCDALHDLIQAAQTVYTRNCPIATPT